MKSPRQALAGYNAILRGDSEPSFKRVRGFGASFRKDAGLEELFALHGKAMARFRGGGKSRALGGGSLLGLKAAIASKIMDGCALCEWRCGTARSKGQRGRCGVLDARVASEFLHMGEEPELVPSHTVFFSGCTFECAYCQNHDISQNPGAGESISPEDMACLILRRAPTARNVNWVGGDPTSNLLFILETLAHVDARLPQVWNSNMYLTPESMALLDGVVDLYLTDFKYGNDACARRLSKAERYWEVTTRNHLLAAEQADMIIRHLVLPGHVECCSKPVLSWIAGNMEGARVNVMDQYRPQYLASEYPEINRPLRPEEYLEAREHARALGLDLVD